MNEQLIDRRTAVKAMAALVITGAASVIWDANVNGGRPAETNDERPDETNDDDDGDP